MFQLFDEHPFPSLPASYAFAQARYAYLWNDFDRGLSYVKPILKAHFDLNIADDTFLYIRGMPFFGQTWAYFAAFYELKGDLEPAVQLTQDAKRQLIEYDTSHLEKFLIAVRSADFPQIHR